MYKYLVFKSRAVHVQYLRDTPRNRFDITSPINIVNDQRTIVFVIQFLCTEFLRKKSDYEIKNIHCRYIRIFIFKNIVRENALKKCLHGYIIYICVYLLCLFQTRWQNNRSLRLYLACGLYSEHCTVSTDKNISPKNA